VLDVVLLILKIGTLLLLFFFIYWVVRSARRDLVASPSAARPAGVTPPGSDGPFPYPAAFGGFPEQPTRHRDAPAAAGERPEASWSRAGVAPGVAAGPGVTSAGPVSAATHAAGREGDAGAERSGAVASVPRLVVVRSTTLAAGSRLDLQDQLTMGRAPESDVVLGDPFVSSSHARVVRRAEGVFVEDLGSTNGTFVNERAVTEARLTAESRLRIGETVFRLEE
jgi:hypothetical protein